MAENIIGLFTYHLTYVEPFGGGGSVLLRKPRAKNEIYNDLDSDIVNLFRVLRSREDTEALCQLVEATPFARDEMTEAWQETDDQIEQARRLLVRSHMGFGSCWCDKG